MIQFFFEEHLASLSCRGGRPVLLVKKYSSVLYLNMFNLALIGPLGFAKMAPVSKEHYHETGL